MAPDRGASSSDAPSPTSSSGAARGLLPEDDDVVAPGHSLELTSTRRSDLALYATPSHRQSGVDDRPTSETHFTLRSLLLGLLIGVVIAFSNTYFGLQTGWVSGMTMPASLLGFAFFKPSFIARRLTLPFTPVENVLVQTVAGAVGTMPLGLGFVGVIPALEFLLKDGEGGPLDLSMWRLVVWGIGLCLFGVVFAVPLRKEVIIRERLKFPSGTATALLIGVLHGGAAGDSKDDRLGADELETRGTEERRELLASEARDGDTPSTALPGREAQGHDIRSDWKAQIRLLLIAFGGSGIYTLAQYFMPVLHRLPIFGTYLASTWLWDLNPSPAYVGQGIIMGPVTTSHMLLGAVIGWGVLSPMAKHRGWAPGPVSNWETGSKGWIVWVSLAIMLADSIINLGWLVLRPTIRHGPDWLRAGKAHYEHSSSWKEVLLGRPHGGYSVLKPSRTSNSAPLKSIADEIPDDAPPDQLISGRTITILLPLTLLLCLVTTHITFGHVLPLQLSLLSLTLALLLSIMGVRALGETDLNPVSGISKLTQLVFALVTPADNKNAIVINLLAGAVSEAGALQAGDMMQDLKSGHLLGASPKAQFWGQMAGSVVGAVVSALIYRLYVSVYRVPGELFQVPTAYVWVFTARLVTGKGLPDMAWQYAVGAGGVFVALTALRIHLIGQPEGSWRRALHPFVPGGIAVAVGMYNTPSFTLARAVGGAIAYWWLVSRRHGETKAIVLASGLILGEGVISILNLGLASLGVAHL